MKLTQEYKDALKRFALKYHERYSETPTVIGDLFDVLMEKIEARLNKIQLKVQDGIHRPEIKSKSFGKRKASASDVLGQ